uniref:Uncharacterized protein n=1 Tax=Syphacia muris TaxID=451379 RepID=A0A0N5B0A1_9BILA
MNGSTEMMYWRIGRWLRKLMEISEFDGWKSNARKWIDVGLITNRLMCKKVRRVRSSLSQEEANTINDERTRRLEQHTHSVSACLPACASVRLTVDRSSCMSQFCGIRVVSVRKKQHVFRCARIVLADHSQSPRHSPTLYSSSATSIAAVAAAAAVQIATAAVIGNS